MTLLTPALAIAGVCAVAIPILIHLLMRQRRRPVEFAAMRFLIEAFRKHKRRLQLEQMVLLAVRCLTVALLGLALARPLLEGASMIQGGGGRTITLVIDNGLTSAAENPDGQTVLFEHIESSVSIVRSLSPGDSVSVITAARPARPLLTPPSSDLAAVINLLQSIEPAQSPTDLGGAFAFVRDAAGAARESARPAVVYLLSDFRAGSARLDSPLPVLGADLEDVDVRLLASPASSEPITNIRITAIEPVRSLIVPNAGDGSNQVKVRLARSGGEMGADVSRVRLSGEGLLAIAPRTVQWKPGQSEADVDFTLDFGLENDRSVALTASIDDDALDADNSRRAVLDLRSSLRVLLIDRRSFGFERALDQLTAGQWLRRALEPMLDERNRPISVVEAEPAALDVADLRTADVALAPRPDLISATGWELLRAFVDRGGLLLVMPPSEVNVHQWVTPFVSAMDVPWRIALEASEFEQGRALAPQQPASEMLRLISSDLSEMSRAVQVYRVLPLSMTAIAARQADEPTVNASAPTTAASTPATSSTLLQLDDGSPVLAVASPASGGSDAAGNPAAGLVAYLAVTPEVSWTNLPTKPLMVPLMHEVVRQGASLIRAAQRSEVGEQPMLAQALPSGRDLRAPDGRVIPLDRGRPQQPLMQAGVYTITDASSQPLGLVAVNVDSDAGMTDVQSAAAVGAWLEKSAAWSTFDPESVAATLGAAGSGSPLSGILLVVVLGLLVIETVLARWFSHAYRSEASGDRWSIRPSIANKMPAVAVATSSSGEVS